MENHKDISGLNMPDPKDWMNLEQRVLWFESMLDKEVYCVMTFRQDYELGGVYVVTPKLISLVKEGKFDGIEYES